VSVDYGFRDERGQAYTLQAVIGGLVILTAFLFALQSIIITPTTTSAVDPEVRTDLRQQAADILTITSENETTDLSYYVRYWDQNRQTFAGEAALNPDVGYGDNPPPGVFGEMLDETFTERGRFYSVEMFYRQKNFSESRERIVMVDQGTPAEGAVVASRNVVLYDNQTLTSDRTGTAELWEYGTDPANNENGYYPIPNAVGGPVYNVVEVRVTVW
jgi:hypothetical protein